jgi:hypothetical protein
MTAASSPAPSDAIRLRAWQVAALTAYAERERPDFLVTATPGAGKTTFALALATRLLQQRVVDRLIVVAPTDHLRTQWARAAARFGIDLDPTLTNSVGPVRADMRGYVTTYAQVAAAPMLHRARCGGCRSPARRSARGSTSAFRSSGTPTTPTVCGRRPTSRTATGRPSRTAWFGPSFLPRTQGFRAGGTRRAR